MNGPSHPPQADDKLDEQGFTVWQRLDACDRAILFLTTRKREDAVSVNKLALVQEENRKLKARVLALERSYLQLLETLTKAQIVKPVFGASEGG
jgi:hypothetical protein